MIPPGFEAQAAQLEQLAGDAADAAEVYGVDSPQHDAALEAYDEYAGEHEAEAGG